METFAKFKISIFFPKKGCGDGVETRHAVSLTENAPSRFSREGFGVGTNLKNGSFSKVFPCMAK